MSKTVNKTTLVNLHTYKGRDYVLIDRRTQFGNLFKMGVFHFYLKRKMTREDTIKLFQERFDNMIKNYPKFRAAVEALRGKKLACWCTPLACHGDVIVEYLEGEKE